MDGNYAISESGAFEIKNKLKENRSHLSDSSVNTYSSTLKNLFYKVFPNSTFDIKLFNKSKEILKYLEDVSPNKRKSILSSLFVLTKDPIYQKNMVQDINNYVENVKMEVKTPTQENYWIEKDELDSIYNQIKNKAVYLFKKKELTKEDLNEIQNYIILSLYTLIPPRRSLDFTEMKIKNISPDDNHIEKNNFVFTKYKTAKFNGIQHEEIPKELMSILKKWIKINPTDYLLFDSNKNKLTPSKLTRRINKIFNKNISTSALRHLYISHKYQNYIKENKSLENDMIAMGSSMIQIPQYLKKDI
jgi:integrase